MSESIREHLGFDSTIKIPNDFRSLFESLDFSTKYGGFDIPLQHRGDGIQARHIPFVLEFIAQKSKTHHIWAYEEPENSLEMSKAFELAEQFQNSFSKDNQIFLTTHSPAFYGFVESKSSRWFVASESHNNNEAQKITSITKIDDCSKRHQNGKAYAILLPKVEDSTQEYWDKDHPCIEFLFSKNYMKEHYVEEKYKLKGAELTKDEGEKLKNEDLFSYQLEYKVKPKKKGTTKKAFAEKKVPEFPAEAFENFKILFENIQSLLEVSAS